MKKVISLLLALCLIQFPLEYAFAAGSDVVIDASWSVSVSAAATAQESFAAQKLSEELSGILGASIPVVTSASGKHIAVGAASVCDVSGLRDNGYRITISGGNVQIKGTGIRGTVCGVYRFLEDFCGRKVYTSSITVLPRAENIRVPADTNTVYEPYFEYTDTDWRSPCNTEYSIANGLTGGIYRNIPDEMGGTVNYLGGFCHTLTSQYCSAAVYFDSHPEYFALRDGKRTSQQLCLTNPDTVETVKSEVLALLAREHDPQASLQIISVTQADNQNYCECNNCKAFEAAHGGVHSATMINFVNRIADAVKAEGYNNVAIDTFAYQYTRKAPKGITPRDNVIVRLCTIECCFSHALNDPGCEKNAELIKDLNNWSEICSRIYIWDYTTNYAHTCCVFPDFGVIQKNLQVFYEHNVKGVYEEGNYYIRDVDTEFGELRSYMLSKCLQNPYCDLDAEINGFLNAYYGPGGEYIRRAI